MAADPWGARAHRIGAVAACCLIASVVGGPSSAAAQRAEEVSWQAQWDRVSTVQYVYLGAVALTEAFLEYGPVRDRVEPRIGGFWPGDRPFRNLVHVDDPSTERALNTFDDPLWWVALGFPIYADTLAAAWIGHGEPAVAWQLAVISLQALLTVTLVARILHVTVRRQRPIYYLAEQRGETPNTESLPSLSFPGGHAATSFAGAGLACSFHRHLPLFGGGLGDDLVCPSVLTVATLVGVLRIAIDRHYLSDTWAGAALGFSVGYLLPELIHFHEGPSGAAWWLPRVGEGEIGVSLGVLF